MNWLSEQTFSQRRYTDNKQAQEKKKFNIANHQRNTDQNHEGFLGGSVVKNLLANARDMRDVGSIPGSRRTPPEGNGNPLQDSCLENPMQRGA